MRLLCALLLALAAAGCAAPAAQESAAEPTVKAVDLNPTEAAMRKVPITMYMTTWCPVCRRAAAYLERHGYSFQMKDVERDAYAATFHRMVNPAGSVPMFEMGQRIVIGWDPALLRRALLRVVRERQAKPVSQVDAGAEKHGK